MRSSYLVCYDIADEKRLMKVYRFMKERGIHIQYSVFYCVLTYEELKALKTELQSLINPRYDDVRIYPLPENSLVAVLGKEAIIPEGVKIFIKT